MIKHDDRKSEVVRFSKLTQVFWTVEISGRRLYSFSFTDHDQLVRFGLASNFTAVSSTKFFDIFNKLSNTTKTDLNEVKKSQHKLRIFFRKMTTKNNHNEL